MDSGERSEKQQIWPNHFANLFTATYSSSATNQLHCEVYRVLTARLYLFNAYIM